MKQEIWKDISGYKGIYQISNYGNVKSFHNYGKTKERILLPKNKNGYLTVGLRKNGIRKWHLIHRLVAQAFIQNKNNYKCVNHKDENKLNNKVENLEWCTHEYNNCYGTRTERASKNNPLKCKIKCIETDIIYNSISECSRSMNISASNICKVINEKKDKVKGYHFERVVM